MSPWRFMKTLCGMNTFQRSLTIAKNLCSLPHPCHPMSETNIQKLNNMTKLRGKVTGLKLDSLGPESNSTIIHLLLFRKLFMLVMKQRFLTPKCVSEMFVGSLIQIFRLLSCAHSWCVKCPFIWSLSDKLQVQNTGFEGRKEESLKS